MISGSDGDVLIEVHVQPGARRTGVVGRHGTALKLAVQAPARDGAANDAVRRLLADLCGCGFASVEVVRGERGRSKLIRVLGVGRHGVRTAIERALVDAGAGPT